MSVEKHVQEGNGAVKKASLILSDRDAELARRWDAYPESRMGIARLFAFRWLLGRDPGWTSLHPDTIFTGAQFSNTNMHGVILDQSMLSDAGTTTHAKRAFQ
ncbi:MAG: hypothetical protein V3U65_03135 [Granulosicoccaceae bacterium]